MAVKQALANKANGNAVQKKSTAKNLRQMIKVMQPEIEKALPSVITPERFTRMVLTAVSTTPQLANCTQDSFMGAMMSAAQLGLEPNTPLGQAYIIPYRDRSKGVMQAQFQIGYKGLIDLAHRSGEFKSIDARVVYENDTFEYEYGLEPKLIHKPATTNRGKAIFYYACYTLVNGGFGFEVMSVEDVKEHRRKYSKARTSPWDTNFDEMARKTVLKRVLKYAPIKTEFAKQVNADNTTKTTLSDSMIDEQDQTDWDNMEEAEVEVIDDEEPAAQEPAQEQTEQQQAFIPIPEDDLPFSTEPEQE